MEGVCPNAGARRGHAISFCANIDITSGKAYRLYVAADVIPATGKDESVMSHVEETVP
jgi:hypothetical protein